MKGEKISLTGGFATLDGSDTAVQSVTGALADRVTLAQALAAQLAERRAARPGAPRVLVTRAATESQQLSGPLAEHGIAAVCIPAIEIEVLDSNPDLQAAISALARFRWAVVTSANGARAVIAAAERMGVDLGRVRWAAVGHATARRLMQGGAPDVWLPSTSNAATLARELPVEPADEILWIHGDLADQSLAETLRARGAVLTAVNGYRTIVAPSSSRDALRRAMADGPFAVLTFASPSAVEGLLALAPPEAHAALAATPVATVGPRTASAARAAGFREVVEAPSQDAGVLAEVAAELALRTTKEVVRAQ